MIDDTLPDGSLCMSEQTRESTVVTADGADFAAYRRHGQEIIPLLVRD